MIKVGADSIVISEKLIYCMPNYMMKSRILTDRQSPCLLAKVVRPPASAASD